MDYDGIGNAFKAMHRLSIIGMYAIAILLFVGCGGLLFLLWWAWNHVSIAIH